jgi:hypothetical protein
MTEGELAQLRKIEALEARFAPPDDPKPAAAPDPDDPRIIDRRHHMARTAQDCLQYH